MDDRTKAGARPPDPPQLLQRRVVAGLIDLICIGLITGAAAVVASTRVPAIRQPDGSVTFTATDRLLLDGMTGPLSRGHLLGDTLWAFSTRDVIAVTAAAAVAGIITGALVPRLAGGRSPGKILLGMRVVTLDGQSAGLARHLMRTVAAPADLMPIVVPGLTGYAFAASNPRQQRIGDRLAKTIVVEKGEHSGSAAPASKSEAPVSAATNVPTNPVPTIKSATLLRRGVPAQTVASLNRRPEPPDLVGDEAASPSRAGDTVDMNERDSASEQSAPPTNAAAAPIPVEERSNNPYPKPVRRSRKTAREATLPDFDSLTLPESSLSDMPLTNTALFEALGMSPPDGVTPSQPDVEEQAAPADPPAANERPEPSAPQPKVTPSTDRSPARDEGRHAAPVVGTAAVSPREASSPAPNKRAPIWSEDWDAWIYWDTTLQNWFRHDKETGNWVPMDED